jgi:hypothetical protein
MQVAIVGGSDDTEAKRNHEMWIHVVDSQLKLVKVKEVLG